MNLYDEVDVFIVSGKRPGGITKRPTEKYTVNGEVNIVSNDSTGYDSRYGIINVDQERIESVRSRIALDEFATLSALRTIANDIGQKRFVCQLDDNIHQVYVSFQLPNGTVVRKMIWDITPVINLLVDVLKFTNAGMAGILLMSTSVPKKLNSVLSPKGYPYSFYVLDRKKQIPDYMGTNEDDITMKLQLHGKKTPTAMINAIGYSKKGQESSGDTTGNRREYDQALFRRGEFVQKFYGDVYTKGATNRRRGVNKKEFMYNDDIRFTHKIKPIERPLVVTDPEMLKEAFRRAFDELESSQTKSWRK